MNLKMRDLEKCFEMAKTQGARWIAVVIRTEGNEGSEVIVNPNVNFDAKLDYYRKAYTDDLVLKSYNGIKIVGFTHANTQ